MNIAKGETKVLIAGELDRIYAERTNRRFTLK